MSDDIDNVMRRGAGVIFGLSAEVIALRQAGRDLREALQIIASTSTDHNARLIARAALAAKDGA